MKSKVFLFTATLMLMVGLWVYEPCEVTTYEEVVIRDEVEGLSLYCVDAFKDTGFFFVRADNFNGYAKYEVIQTTGNIEWLRLTLTEHLKVQGYDGDILIMLLNPTNREEVISWE